VGFYYISILSIPVLGVVYGLLLLLFWGIASVSRGMRGRKVFLFMVGAVFLVLPVAEEFWIAWNFGHLCRKDAGLMVNKKVEVEGFYDDTHSWRADKLRKSGFKWVEGRDRTTSKKLIWRHEWDGNEIRSAKIERPTAKYRFFIDRGVDIGHKLSKQEFRVLDSEAGEVIGEYRVYIRGAPWFYIGLDRLNMGCDGPDAGPHTKHKNSFLIYRDVLIPGQGGSRVLNR